eukprot:2883626-Pleurochrysis_carterae.AAC.1
MCKIRRFHLSRVEASKGLLSLLHTASAVLTCLFKCDPRLFSLLRCDLCHDLLAFSLSQAAPLNTLRHMLLQAPLSLRAYCSSESSLALASSFLSCTLSTRLSHDRP